MFLIIKALYVLLIIKALYGLKSSKLQFNELLVKHLSSLGFVQSKYEANIYY